MDSERSDSFTADGRHLAELLGESGIDVASGFHEVAAALGGAVIWAQLFETTARACSIAPNRTMDGEPEDAVQRAARRSLNNAILRLESARKDGDRDAIPTLLGDARVVRNWLIHDFVPQSVGQLFSGTVAPLVHQLEMVASIFEWFVVRLLAGPVLDQAVASVGVDDADELRSVLVEIAAFRPDVFAGDIRDGGQTGDALVKLADELGIVIDDD